MPNLEIENLINHKNKDQSNSHNCTYKHDCKYDQLGIFGSLICGFHCVITPLIISLFLSMKVNNLFLQGWESLNWVFFSIAPILGFLGLRIAYKKHLSLIPFFSFLLGLSILAFGLFIPMQHNIEHFVSSIGGLIMAIAHFVNLKLLQS